MLSAAVGADERVSAAHRAKLAYVYVRQSSVNQVRQHQESTELQYRLVDRAVGLARVEAFHLNDCKKPRGCRVDRHEHIGEGEIGLAAFRRLVNDPRFTDIPAFLETELRFKENLAVLRSLKR